MLKRDIKLGREYARKIIAIREEGATQAEIATALKVSINTVREWQYNRITPGVENRKKIDKLYIYIVQEGNNINEAHAERKVNQGRPVRREPVEMMLWG